MLPLLLLVSPPAVAQVVSAVPPGARAVTVMACATAEGCELAFAAMAEHCAGLGIPLLDFDVVASAGPGGGEARAALDDALNAARGSGPAGRSGAHPADPSAWEDARAALRATPLTIEGPALFELWLGLAAARASGDASRESVDEALAAAASSSRGRIWDLPALSPPLLERYLALAGRDDPPAVLTVTADVPGASVYVDGLLIDHAPVTLPLPPGWHRVSVERPGRRTAWVGEVQLRSGANARVDATIAADDAPAALEAAVVAAIRGAEAPPDVPRRLADWARTQGLTTVRFVEVGPARRGAEAPEERVLALDSAWDVHAAWLDVAAGRFDDHGPGPATLRAAADPGRLRVGVGLGYARIQGAQPTGPDPHDALTVEATVLVALRPSLALDARVGVWRAAQPWYLYEDWLAYELVPVSLGARWTFGPRGPWVGAHALALVPTALGGELYTGWAWQPSTRWSLGVEARAGWTDAGPLLGGGLTLLYAG